ncbi:hypothetical protein [Amycolatopsis rifamycinica]|uniref:Uncharacterized protein n=1 Tax=Amycolatopsis rifamycinica TaxID=287986 RepID=A0A066UCT3_9PSEU|nr:hypothetical protein [Amycolatopsis rifamycinica]KDN22043.1 hypothetical protein DV20_11705 [Amycolatopsis rifamycinica]
MTKTRARHAGAVPPGRRYHRGRRAAIALAVGVPALVVPALVLTRDDSDQRWNLAKAGSAAEPAAPGHG